MSRTTRVPAYRRHSSGQARVTIDGKDLLLGRFGSIASKEAYRRAVAEWLARPAKNARGKDDKVEPLTLNELILTSWKFAEEYYEFTKTPGRGDEHCLRATLKLVRSIYGNVPSTTFGPLALKACREAMGLTAALKDAGVTNVNSHPQLKRFFQSEGMLDSFAAGTGHSFDDDRLKAVEHRHAAVHKVRLLRKVIRLLSDRAFRGELTGADGRLHPEHRQLGAESGRNGMRWPNLGGIGRDLRPVVVPDEGYGIGEVDLSQIEPGIAAAWYGDSKLIDMFNGRDVYSAMGRTNYASELGKADLDLPDPEFKKKFGRYRDRMKVFTLATIYGITPHGLGRQLGVPAPQAGAEQDKFMAMFPDLTTALREAAEYGAMRGFAEVCSGLRRRRALTGPPSSWERNWLCNLPVQGSAAVVFKVAGNRLRQRYQQYGARLILPMHDAFVFEAPRTYHS